ncbi:MAG TPA: hypothetical protein VEF92_06815 [Burkholderiales bacterium]|nr:hypothetical protein [Burkholderiales bacterium]HYA47248.1 hypothetical protein [Burkholderiales bacterium]
MSEPDDLLGKADAFLKRYHPSSGAAKHDVPVLTEIIDEGRGAAASPAPGGAVPSPPKTELLELEQRLKQTIDTHVQSALAGVSTQLKAELESVIRETVARAVAAEIARLRRPSRGG